MKIDEATLRKAELAFDSRCSDDTDKSYYSWQLEGAIEAALSHLAAQAPEEQVERARQMAAEVVQELLKRGLPDQTLVGKGEAVMLVKNAYLAAMPDVRENAVLKVEIERLQAIVKEERNWRTNAMLAAAPTTDRE